MKQQKLPNETTALLCRSFSPLLHGGMPLADSAHLLSREETGASAVLKTLGLRLDEGVSLSEAMAQCGAFPAYVPGLVRVGEETGRLEEALQSLAEYYEQQARIKARLKQALGWPCLMLVMMLAVTGVLLVKVLPVFDGVYASLGSRLTGAAAGLLQLGQLIGRFLPVLAGVAMLVALLTAAAALSDRLQKALLGWFYEKFGDRWLFRRFNNARYARALAMALGSGLALEDAMELATVLLADIPGAVQRIDGCAAALRSGADLSQAMECSDLLPPSGCRLLAAGLQGGNGDRVMEHLAGTMMEDACRALDDWSGRVEPALVLLTAALVGLVLLSAMLPLMNILSSLG